MLSLPEITRQTLHQHGLIPAGSRVVIAVSGGADSLALLHVLHHLALDAALYVATFDHMLRGSASVADCQFVLDTAHAWGIPAFSGHTDVQHSASQAGGTEAAARRARYAFLASIARQIDATHIATAHHASDQAETLLLHLVRGSGARGLVGMRPAAPLPGQPDLTLIRPFLYAPRPVIDTYCVENDLHPRDDQTNRDTRYQRNAIRWRLLPELERLNPGIITGLTQLADIMATEQDFIDLEMAERLTGHLTIGPDRISVNRTAFADLHPALQRRFIQWASQRLATGSLPGYEHTLHAVQVGLASEIGALAQLPGGLQLRVDYHTLALERTTAPLPDVPLLRPGEKIIMSIPGRTALGGGWHLEARHDGGGQARLVIAPGQEVSLRTRQSGDRFAPLGLGGHTQSIKKWMINAKVPRALRDSMPLLLVDGEIAAILTLPQWFISEHYAVRQPDQPIVYFSLTHTTG